MSDMIERVAKAIYEKFEDRPAYAKRQMNGILAEELARAAIEAMRVPTKAMILAGVHHDNMGDMEGRWMAMIDAVLSQDTHSLPSEDR